MSKPESYSNESLSQLWDDLEKMQHYLLMVKAAVLAFDGKFNEHCPYIHALSPFSKEETAEYFICQFLELDPDAKLEQAMNAVSELQKLGAKAERPKNKRTDEATIKIFFEKD